MKKIAIITSGLLPMPAIKDGAIEMLLEYTINYNEMNKKYDFTIFSIYDEIAEKEAKKYKNTKFKYIKINNMFYKMEYLLLKVMRKLGYKDPNFQRQFVNKCLNILIKSDFDYIIIESENHFVRKILKKCNIPVILYLHNDKLNKKTKEAKKILDQVYSVFTVSDYIRNQVLEINPKIPNKIITIHNGIDVSIFLNTNEKKNTELKLNNYSIKENIFLFVGRIEPSKGVLELVKAFNKLKVENTKLIIIGGTFHSSSKKSKYLKLVEKEAKNNKNINFMGYIAHNKLPYFYELCDVLVVPSMWEEPAGLVNIEAISSGIKLIVSNSGGMSEYINDETIVFDKNSNTIENLEKSLLKSMTTINKMDNSNYLKYFSKEEYVKRYYANLDKIIK